MDTYSPQFWEPTQKPEPGFDQINWNHPAAGGLIACYAKTEGAGLVTNDSAGISVRGTRASGVSWALGKYGPCLSFNGVANLCYLNLTEGGVPAKTGGDFSLFQIINYTGTGIVAITFATTGAGRDAYHFAVGVTNLIGFTLSNVANAPAGPAITTGANWAVACSYRRLASVRYWAKNLDTGALSTSTVTITNTPTAVTGQIASIGAKWNGDSPFLGTISQTLAWNYAVPDTVFAGLAADPFGLFAPTMTRSHGALTYATSPLRSRILQSRIIRGAA